MWAGVEVRVLSPSYPNSCSGHLRSSLLSRKRQRKLKDVLKLELELLSKLKIRLVLSLMGWAQAGAEEPKSRRGRSELRVLTAAGNPGS